MSGAEELARTILDLLDNRDLTRVLRSNARAYAEERLQMKDYLAQYCSVIEGLTGQDPTPGAKPKAVVPRIRRTVRGGPGSRLRTRVVEAAE